MVPRKWHAGKCGKSVIFTTGPDKIFANKRINNYRSACGGVWRPAGPVLERPPAVIRPCLTCIRSQFAERGGASPHTATNRDLPAEDADRLRSGSAIEQDSRRVSVTTWRGAAKIPVPPTVRIARPADARPRMQQLSSLANRPYQGCCSRQGFKSIYAWTSMLTRARHRFLTVVKELGTCFPDNPVTVLKR